MWLYYCNFCDNLNRLLKLTFELFQVKAVAVRSIKPESVWSFKDPFVLYIAELWQNSGIQSAYRRRREFQLTDSANLYIYFFLKVLFFYTFIFCSFLTELCRLSKENYVPTDQDILRVQDATTGIVEYQFVYYPYPENFWY